MNSTQAKFAFSNRKLHESLHRALDMRDHADPKHHAHAAEMDVLKDLLEELDAEFDSPYPSSERLRALLDQRDMFRSRGLQFDEEESVWMNEFDKAIREAEQDVA